MTDIFNDKTTTVSLAECRETVVMVRMEPSDAPGTHVPGMLEGQRINKAVVSVTRPRRGYGY
jgi:hypothetical protein